MFRPGVPSSLDSGTAPRRRPCLARPMASVHAHGSSPEPIRTVHRTPMVGYAETRPATREGAAPQGSCRLLGRAREGAAHRCLASPVRHSQHLRRPPAVASMPLRSKAPFTPPPTGNSFGGSVVFSRTLASLGIFGIQNRNHKQRFLRVRDALNAS